MNLWSIKIISHPRQVALDNYMAISIHTCLLDLMMK